jgi:hypothetical protein
MVNPTIGFWHGQGPPFNLLDGNSCIFVFHWIKNLSIGLLGLNQSLIADTLTWEFVDAILSPSSQ